MSNIGIAYCTTHSTGKRKVIDECPVYPVVSSRDPRITELADAISVLEDVLGDRVLSALAAVREMQEGR